MNNVERIKTFCAENNIPSRHRNIILRSRYDFDEFANLNANDLSEIKGVGEKTFTEMLEIQRLMKNYKSN